MQNLYWPPSVELLNVSYVWMPIANRNFYFLEICSWDLVNFSDHKPFHSLSASWFCPWFFVMAKHLIPDVPEEWDSAFFGHLQNSKSPPHHFWVRHWPWTINQWQRIDMEYCYRYGQREVISCRPFHRWCDLKANVSGTELIQTLLQYSNRKSWS